jgi:transposase
VIKHHDGAGDDSVQRRVVSMPDYVLFVGIDWATATHRVALANAAGERLGERSIAHSGAGLAGLVAELTRLVPDAGRIAVAIEVPRGAVVHALLSAGCHVFALNPKQLDRFRDRHTVAGAKDDRRDAFVLADALRTDPLAFRRLDPEDPRLIHLRQLSRVHDELVQERLRLANRLREQLVEYFPGLLTLAPAADEPWLWSLLEQAPTPARAAALRANTLRALLARHRIRRFSTPALQEVLRAPALPVAPGTLEAATEYVALLLPRLRLVYEQARHCERRLEVLLAAFATDVERPEHRDVTILRSLPGVGRVVAATMLAEAWRPLAARDYQTLRAQAGIAPVTRQSGKMRVVTMRRSCNPRLRTAVFYWAQNCIKHDATARAHYERLRVRHGRARALRGVADRMLGVLVAMLSSGTAYEPARRAARVAA